jgi:hypothetical protein
MSTHKNDFEAKTSQKKTVKPKSFKRQKPKSLKYSIIAFLGFSDFRETQTLLKGTSARQPASLSDFK